MLSLTNVLAILGFPVSAASLWYAFRALPRRALRISRQSSTRLVNKLPEDGSITVMYAEHIVEDARVTILDVRCTGRHAVTTEHFDQSRPIKVNLGAPILGILDRAGSLKSSQIAFEGENLVLGPDLYKPKDSLTIHLLTAEPSSADVKRFPVEDHLIDTRIEYVPEGQAPKAKRLLETVMVYSVCTALAMFVAWAVLNRPGTPRIELSASSVHPGALLEARISGMADHRIGLVFMGERQEVTLSHGRGSVNLLVPPSTPTGNYVVVVLNTAGGYADQTTASFQVN